MAFPTDPPSDTSLCAARWIAVATAANNCGFKLQQWSVNNSQWVDVPGFEIDGTQLSPSKLVS